jgi:tetratricopeptide (TPR) repeat protein
MICVQRIFTILLITLAWLSAPAQDVSNLVKEGQQLNSAKKYAEAIEKYKSALAIEPANPGANYQMAFTLYLSGKGANGIPYLDKSIKGSTSPQLTAGSYSLMGSIYGSNKQLPQAIEAYKNGIKADSTNQRIYYNLGIVYYRSKLYTEAGQSFLQALKRDNNYADSQRMYALAAFHENKRAEALLGFSRFLLLEPNTGRSAEAFGNLQSILQGGALKPEQGYRPSAIAKGLANQQNQVVGKALLGFAANRYASQNALLTAQLKAIFTAIATDTKNSYPFAEYFNKLAQTKQLSTFAYVISQKAYPESVKWVGENAEKVAEFDAWAKANKSSL